MKKHTKEFKSSISTFGRELDSKIFILGTELVLEKEDLFSITPVVNSEILKTVMKEVDFESKKQIGIGQEVNVKSGVKVNNEYEYMNYGNYSVYKSEYKAETDTYSHICYDKMLKTMIDYIPLEITYPINLREYINAIATKCGLEFADKNSTFANYNTPISEDHFSNGNYTFRDVLDYIAQLVGGWFCINDNDELEIKYPELARNYGETNGENVSFISNAEDIINTIVVDGKSTQATRSGKNIFNKNANFKSNGATKEVLDTGVRSKLINSGNYRYFSIELGKSELLGKTIILNRTITNSASNIGRIAIYFGNETSQSKKIIFANKESETSNIYIPNTFPDDCDRLWILFYGNVAGTGNVGDYVDYTNLMITIGATLENYEDYGVSPSPDYPSEVECIKGKNLYGNITWQVQTYAYTQLPTLNEDYTLSLKLKEGKQIPAGLYVMFSEKGIYDATQKRQQIISNGKQEFAYIVNTLDNVKLNYISVYPSEYKDTLQDFFDIQLEKGTVATSYLPYNTIQVKDIGKNLFDWTGVSNTNIATFENGVATLTWTTGFDCFLLNKSKQILSGLNTTKTYTISFKHKGNAIYLKDYQTTGNQVITDVDNDYKIYSFDITGVESVRLDVLRKDTTGTAYIKELMITSTSDTTFEPYQENITNIDLQGNELCSLPNNVKDELVIENSRAKIIKNVGKAILNGSENWTVLNKTYFTQFKDKKSNKIFGDNNLISDYFKQTPQMTSTTILSIGEMTESYYSSGNLNIFFNYDNGIGSVDNFKTRLSTHNTTVYYQLATPTEIALGEVDTLSTFKGVNNVSLDANMQTNMNLIYTAEYEELDKHFLKDVNVSFSKKYGAVNSVVFSRGNGSDNIYRKDNASINKNGLTEIKIANNPFLEGDDRESFIQSLFDKINGLEFYIMDVASTGIMYLELGDIYYFNMVEEKPSLKSGLVKSGLRKAQGSSGGKYLCLLMNDEIKITQGLEESIYNDEPEITETDYKTASITDTSIKNAIIQTNKNSAEILLKVNNDEVVSAINLSPESIKISSAKLDIDAIATFTNSKLAEAGSTVINGANITTGSINCDRLNGGTINGQAIRGGSVSITKGVYYFNMGASTSNPNCSGLNVGKYGIKAYSNITATGFAITDSDTGKSQSINIYDGHGKVWYLTFTGGILTASEYK